MIRKIIQSDIEKIKSLEESVFGHSLGDNILTEALTNSFAYFYVYEKNDELVGYISSIFDGYLGEILNFCVNKDYQNQGIGKELLGFILDVFKEKNAEGAILEVRESNLRAIHVYEGFGFKKISVRKHYYADGENALVLKKKL